MKKFLMILSLLSTLNAFAGTCKMFVPSFDVQHPEGTDQSIVEREINISQKYKALLESELSLKGYTTFNLQNFDFDGATLGINIDGYKKTPAKCLISLHLREFRTYDVFGAPATELINEKYYSGKSFLGLLPREEMPDCSKAFSRAIKQIEQCC